MNGAGIVFFFALVLAAFLWAGRVHRDAFDEEGL